ncbi:MAG TPA: DNA/RNA helicase domain-containing protein, partial [Candidatus Paceibacterota bacterium]|nr:DNA/RNA helicase domain-containing protein [Candidatus Paceibacterota bacterium]
MIVYQSKKRDFLADVADNSIEDIVLACVRDKLKINVGKNEINSWKNSLREMFFVLDDDSVPNDAGIAIEYRIPQTSKRIDFIITGEDKVHAEQVMLIELKQWSKVQITTKDAIVITRFEQGPSEESHPSYQAWSYASLINGFNETVYEEHINLNPCAYLHNYVDDGVITNSFYAEYIAKAPVFLKNDKVKLREFISKYVKYGDKKDTMYRIDVGKIKPSKSLADSLSSMLKGVGEFVMIDDQKLVYETALALAKKSGIDNKNVLIIDGGPGTGKSVVAINLLVTITKLGLVTRYVTKNSAPRDVYESMLTGHFKKSEISNMFSGSGAFTESEANTFDALIIDEAHRLNEKSGMFKNLGENQIKEIIQTAKLSIFFIDEDQKVTWS